jgi:benzoylformate decarboxylase/acetolactate synthase-1/2/3 large subunit
MVSRATGGGRAAAAGSGSGATAWGRPAATPAWGSDVMADVIAELGIRHVSLNPGSSYRGLHDSLVNRVADRVEMICCPHEKIAVGIAHGYAKATGEPMAAILHNVVGLLHGAMGIYYAWLDRAPVLVLGGAGPAEQTRRRPNIDWIHSANLQGNAVRDFTKWDQEPRSIRDVPLVLARALRIAAGEPRGPVYVALDAGLQEDPLDEPVELPDFSRLGPASPVGPDPRALERLARRLCQARRPVIVPGYAGRDPAAFGQLVELAELVGAGVDDTGVRLSFPNRHPLCVNGTGALEQADCVLFLDVKDMGRPTQRLDSTSRSVTSRLAPGSTVLDLGFNDLGLSSWSEDYAALIETDLQVTADTAVALPMLLDACRRLVAGDDADRRAERAAYAAELRELHAKVAGAWAQEAVTRAAGSPVSTPRLAGEVWDVVKDHDWVLTAGTAAGWAHGQAGGRPAAGRGPDVRRRLAVGGLVLPAAAAGGHVQQPRLLQRLGAPGAHRPPARHVPGAGADRHGDRPARPGLRGAGPLDGLVGRRSGSRSRRRRPRGPPRRRPRPVHRQPRPHRRDLRAEVGGGWAAGRRTGAGGTPRSLQITAMVGRPPWRTTTTESSSDLPETSTPARTRIRPATARPAQVAVPRPARAERARRALRARRARSAWRRSSRLRCSASSVDNRACMIPSRLLSLWSQQPCM